MTAFLSLGCAHQGKKEASVEELNRVVESLRVQNAAYVKKVEELENRVYILSDQLDSRKVNDEKVANPELPTVKLHPAEKPPTATPIVAAVSEPEGDTDVEYAGEAAQRSGRRPVLRLRGDETPILMGRDVEEARPVVVAREAPSPKPNRDMEAFQAYRQGYEELRQGHHEESARIFREFIRRFPSHDLADNAQYWLGECFYDRKDFTTAVREFRRVVERFPQGNKVPDALLKVGFSYLALGSVEAARQTLEQLVRSYPRHEAANLAQARLLELDHGKGSGAANASTTPVNTAVKTAKVPEEIP